MTMRFDDHPRGIYGFADSYRLSGTVVTDPRGETAELADRLAPDLFIDRITDAIALAQRTATEMVARETAMPSGPTATLEPTPGM